MNTFKIVPTIVELKNFAEAAEFLKIGSQDLILTNEYIYEPFIKRTGVKAQFIFQEKYGAGEPTDKMIEAIRSDLPDGIERIIAVGGGTILDIGKILALKNTGSVESIFLKKVPAEKALEYIAIPTTCGTGSEVTNYSVAILTDMQTKIGLGVPQLFPDMAVLIPELTITLPYRVFAGSSIDALIHAVESYLSHRSTDFSLLFAKAAIEMIVKSYQQMVQKGTETWTEHADDFLRASNYAGIAFGNTGVAAVHGLSYPLSSLFHIPHGEANYLVFKGVIDKYAELSSGGGRLEKLSVLVADALGFARTADVWEELFALLDGVFKREPLIHYGVKEEDLDKFVKNVIEEQQRLIINNYVPFRADDIMAIYRSCFDK